MSLLSGLLDHMPPTVTGADRLRRIAPLIVHVWFWSSATPDYRQALTPTPPMQRLSGATVPHHRYPEMLDAQARLLPNRQRSISRKHQALNMTD